MDRGHLPAENVAGRSVRGREDHAPHRATLPGVRTNRSARSAAPTTAPIQSGFYGTENYVPLKPHDQWPIPPGRTRPRTKEELVDALNREISETLVSTDWNFSQNIRNNVNETLSGVRGDNSVKIIGPDLAELENTADRVVRALQKVRGLENVGRVPRPRPVEPEPARRSRQVRAVEPQRQRRAGGGRHGGRRQGLQPDDRGRAELRHHLALSRGTAARTWTRSSTSRST